MQVLTSLESLELTEEYLDMYLTDLMGREDIFISVIIMIRITGQYHGNQSVKN
jgi:hypothetical protein